MALFRARRTRHSSGHNGPAAHGG